MIDSSYHAAYQLEQVYLIGQQISFSHLLPHIDRATPRYMVQS